MCCESAALAASASRGDGCFDDVAQRMRLGRKIDPALDQRGVAEAAALRMEPVLKFDQARRAAGGNERA